jgi:hypothetical protein
MQGRIMSGALASFIRSAAVRICMFVCISTALIISTAAYASVDKKAFMDACVEANDDALICACIADKWLASLTPADKALADDFLHALKTNAEPSAANAAAMMPMVTRFQTMGMQCAMSVPDEAYVDKDQGEMQLDLQAMHAVRSNSYLHYTLLVMTILIVTLNVTGRHCKA